MKAELTREEIRKLTAFIDNASIPIRYMNEHGTACMISSRLQSFLNSTDSDKFVLSDTADVNAKYNHFKNKVGGGK